MGKPKAFGFRKKRAEKYRVIYIKINSYLYKPCHVIYDNVMLFVNVFLFDLEFEKVIVRKRCPNWFWTTAKSLNKNKCRKSVHFPVAHKQGVSGFWWFVKREWLPKTTSSWVVWGSSFRPSVFAGLLPRNRSFVTNLHTYLLQTGFHGNKGLHFLETQKGIFGRFETTLSPPPQKKKKNKK